MKLQLLRKRSEAGIDVLVSINVPSDMFLLNNSIQCTDQVCIMPFFDETTANVIYRTFVD